MRRPLRLQSLVLAALLVLAVTAGCAETPPGEASGDAAAGQEPGRAAATAAGTDTVELAELRRRMVERQITARGVTDTAVLRAMRRVPRHRFVPDAPAASAYQDHPLPIGHGQTISQPYIVAFMAEAAGIRRDDRVLEIGTGSGYGAAVLGELADAVYTVEIVPELAERARGVLDALDYDNVHVRTGNGWLGWPEHAPYDAVVVTAAPDEVPETLVEQLAVGGRLVVPVGELYQELRVLVKTPDGLEERASLPVRFVPMVEKPPDTAR